MAIAKIDKIEIIGLQEEKDRFLNLLQELGIVQLVTAEEAEQKANEKVVSEEEILEIEEAITFLSTFKEKAGFLESLVSLKPVIREEELNNIKATFDYQSLIKKLSELKNLLKELLQHKERLTQEKQLLNPWRKLDIPLDQIHSTRNCGILFGVLYKRHYPKILEDLKRENINLFSDVVEKNKTNVYIALIYLLENFEKIKALLKKYYFNLVTLSRYKCTVRERLSEIDNEILISDNRIKDIKEKITKFLKQRFELMVVYDYLWNIKKRQEAEKNLAKNAFTFNLKGWIKHRDIPILEKAISGQFENVAIFISKPQIEEDIPVDLENNRIIQPFEFITKIYGFPKYSEVDPTPYLAPFFFLYFGFCISDVGYGLILTFLSWFALKKFQMGPQGTKFFRLFFFCGISTMIIGALTGSWFGNLFDLMAESNEFFLPLKKFKDALLILDPLKEPTKLLGIALFFGIVQVWFGNIVAGIGNIKNRRYINVILDQLPMLTLLFGLTGLGLVFLKLFANTYLKIFKYAALTGGITLIFTQGRFEKGVGTKLFFGIYNLYSALSGYLSDILSYSRLWALGLVTGVMASTINLISIQFSNIIVSIVPFINKINFIKILVSGFILIIVFVFGHTFSFLMNLLGAFVHPLRLQFVEFFSKFFKTSGSFFKPFKVETKYFNVK